MSERGADFRWTSRVKTGLNYRSVLGQNYLYLFKGCHYLFSSFRTTYQKNFHNVFLGVSRPLGLTEDSKLMQ
jgi:hypothetical protein